MASELASTLLRFPFDSEDVTAVVTTRHGGVSSGAYSSLNLGDHVGDDHLAVMENRQRLCSALGVDRLTVGDQQHGAKVVEIDESLAGRGHDGADDARDALAATDAMVTRVRGAALAVMVADCAPVAVFDPARRVVGVAHCGRNGTTLGVLPATVESMRQRFGTDPADLRVGIGPCIQAQSYEIGSSEADQVAAVLPRHVLSPTRAGHYSFDIVASLRAQLGAAGVSPDHVFVMNIDTRSATETLFSDRAVRPCGRFMAVIVLR